MNVSIFVGVGRRIILKFVLQKWDGMDWIYLVQDASSDEHGNEPSGSIEGRKFIE
jgi:hypothetical protein